MYTPGVTAFLYINCDIINTKGRFVMNERFNNPEYMEEN